MSKLLYDEERVIKQNNNISSVSYSPDGSRIVIRVY